ncbi:MAG TPA: 2-phospho-L-lactate guanylyltransferase [Terriglobales bacterium]|nr:2-phospho-L-lactate guanylyltransferase [Terriglobales bacterium]
MILIPVKDLREAKQRLGEVLSQEQRTLLAEAMLTDVVEAVLGWKQHPPVALVTSYPFAIRLARDCGFDVIEDRENPGETGAIAMATRVALERGARETLVLPGDMPLLTTAELEAVYAAAPRQGVVLVPSADRRGSNAVLRRPADLIPLRFGNDSFVPHLNAARATGKQVVVPEFEGIGLDVDTPADLAALLSLPTRSRAQLLLEWWKVAERLAHAQSA